MSEFNFPDEIDDLRALSADQSVPWQTEADKRNRICDEIQKLRDQLAAANKRVACTQKERDLLDRIYKEEPGLKEHGIEEFDGWYIHLDEVTRRCLGAWPDGDPGCSESPLEYIGMIIEERDDANKRAEEAERKLIAQQANRDPCVVYVELARLYKLVADKDANGQQARSLVEEVWSIVENQGCKLDEMGDTINDVLSGSECNSIMEMRSKLDANREAVEVLAREVAVTRQEREYFFGRQTHDAWKECVRIAGLSAEATNANAIARAAVEKARGG